MTKTVPVTLGVREALDCDLLAVGCFAGEPPTPAQTQGLPEVWQTALARAASRPGFAGREEQVAETETVGGTAGRRGAVAVHGLGARGEFTGRRLAQWLERATDAARNNGIARLAFLLPHHRETAGEAAPRIARWATTADYRYDRYLSDGVSGGSPLERILLLPPAPHERAFAAALANAAPVAAAIATARDLANAPANEATPAWLEERAAELAASHGLDFSVLTAADLGRQGMGGLLAVGAGAAHPPRLLRLAVGDSGPVVALVGKGVTFDSGGISIKPAADMDEMKYDKCGACSVLALAQAVADLLLPIRLRVYAPVAENALDAHSYRPGDILRFKNGKTAEITNTDAEGRLILADALALASDEGADVLLEYSTLTGGCVVALGHHGAGLFTPHDGLAGDLLSAAERAGERLWRLPIWPEHLEEMQGVHADLRNSATRWGSASTAAAFLSQFVTGIPRWAHLDIAGVAYRGREHKGHAGATGYGIPLTVDFLHRLAGD